MSACGEVFVPWDKPRQRWPALPFTSDCEILAHTPTILHTLVTRLPRITPVAMRGGRKRAAEPNSRPATDDDSRSNRLCIFGAQVRRPSDPFFPLSLLSLRMELRTLLWSASAHGYKKNCVRTPSTTMTGCGGEKANRRRRRG